MARREKSKQDALIDELLQDCHDPKDILGQNGLQTFKDCPLHCIKIYISKGPLSPSSMQLAGFLVEVVERMFDNKEFVLCAVNASRKNIPKQHCEVRSHVEG